MIKSKKDYQDYINADVKANRFSSRFKSLLLCRIYGAYNLLYILYLRRLEYVLNCQKGILRRINKTIISRRLKHWSAFTGISIPPNTFGRGLYIPHWGSIVVNSSARFGNYCLVQSGVNISDGVKGGNHIYIAAGAKILKDVEIVDDVIIAANAVVNKSINEVNVVVAGVPAKKVSEKGFRNRTKV